MVYLTGSAGEMAFLDLCLAFCGTSGEFILSPSGGCHYSLFLEQKLKWCSKYFAWRLCQRGFQGCPTPFGLPDPSYEQEPSARVVGFKVEPISIKHKFQSPSAIWSGVAGEMPPLSTCDKNDFVNPVKLPVNAVSVRPL